MREKKKSNGWVQFWIGFIMIFFGIYQMYKSPMVESVIGQGVLLGQGCIFFFWGIRELIGYGFKGNEKEGIK